MIDSWAISDPQSALNYIRNSLGNNRDIPTWLISQWLEPIEDDGVRRISAGDRENRRGNREHAVQDWINSGYYAENGSYMMWSDNSGFLDIAVFPNHLPHSWARWVPLACCFAAAIPEL